MTHTLHICRTCRKEDAAPAGVRFARKLRAAMDQVPEFSDVMIQDANCMLICGEPIALSLSSPGKFTYLFSNVPPDTDVENVLALLRLYIADKRGAMEDVHPIGCLRFCLIGRAPAA